MRIPLHKAGLKKQRHILYVPRIINQPYQTSQNFSSIQFIILLIKINPHRYLNAACFHFLTAQEKVSSFWITNCVVWLCSVETNSHLLGIVGFTALGGTMAKLVSTLLIDTVPEVGSYASVWMYHICTYVDTFSFLSLFPKSDQKTAFGNSINKLRNKIRFIVAI